MDRRSREDEIRARLADITGPDPSGEERALLGRLIHNFQVKTPRGVDQLGALLRAGTPGEVRDQAHALKGSASNLGADTLAAIFAEVEHAARDGIRLDAGRTLERLDAELTRVHTVLAGLVAELAVDQ